jgi:release factor glutamine methyltransferase
MKNNSTLKVLEAIQLSTDFLEKKRIESPRINAELLLADILGCKRLDLYLSFDRPLSEGEKIKYREYVQRRAKFEPLQYILGYVEFYGLRFNVNSSVLIPRQETEVLIETIISKVTGLGKLNILDIGTGSGNIPISLASKLPDSYIRSIDVSEDAILLAKENAELNNVSSLVDFSVCDIFSFPENTEFFDLIVSNPPYVGKQEYRDLQKEIVDYEPKNAVTDLADGFKFYKKITELSKRFIE